MDPKEFVQNLISSISLAADHFSKAALGLKATAKELEDFTKQPFANDLFNQQHIIENPKKNKIAAVDKENMVTSVVPVPVKPVSVATLVENVAPIVASFSKSPVPTKPVAKKKKDPNAPKAAPSAYALYQKESWKLFKEEPEKKTFLDASKVIGEKWKTMTDEEKKPFVEMSEAAKAEYAKRKKAYDDALKVGGDQEVVVSKKRPVSDSHISPPSSPRESEIMSSPVARASGSDEVVHVKKKKKKSKQKQVDV